MTSNTSPATLTVAPIASVGSNFAPLLDAITQLCHHASLGHRPDDALADADFGIVSRFFEDAYAAILREWQSIYMDAEVGDKVDVLVPWPRRGHTDLLSLGLAVADQAGTKIGSEGLLCSALVCALFTATQSAAFMLFAKRLLPQLTSSLLPSDVKQGLVAGYCGGAGLAIVLSYASSIDELVQLSLQNVRIGFWIGLASDRAAARQRQKAGMPHLVAELQSWALVTINVPMQILEECIDTANAHAEPGQHAYISARSPKDQITVMGFPTTLALLEALFRQSITSKHGSKAIGRIIRIPIYGPFHSEVMLNSEIEKIQVAIAKRRIFADTRLATKDVPDVRSETLSSLYSSNDGNLYRALHGIVPSLLDMIMRSPTRWDKVTGNMINDIERFLSKHPAANVEILNVGPGGSLGQSLVTQLRDANIGAKLVDLEEMIVSSAKSITKVELPPGDAIAIVSTSIRVGGGVKSVEAFWNALNEPPREPVKLPLVRFRIDDYIHEARKPGAATMHEGATYGHFLSDIDKFDARLYSISPREAERLDPHHRLMLECSMEAMERAGYAPNATDSFNPERIATFFALANDDYRDNGGVDIRSFHLTGNGRAFAAGRVSFLNKWSGPSATVDAGEMSVLSALKAATDALRLKKCDTAIVAGANIIMSPTMGIAMDQAGLLAHTGRAPHPPLSSQVQGAVRGEACGAIVLKRLETALRERDPVQAILTGMSSTFAPIGWKPLYGEAHKAQDPEALQRKQVISRGLALKKAIKRAGLSKSSVVAIQCNCSGNAIDEKLELEAVAEVLQGRREPAFIHSSKAHFGDAEAAAGMVSLVATIEMVRRNQLPPYPQMEANSVVKTSASLKLNQSGKAVQLAPEKSSLRRAVAVQSYAIGGGNSVALFESADTILGLQSAEQAHHSAVTQFQLCISASSSAALKKRISDVQEWLAAHPDTSPIDLAYTFACRKMQYPFRICVPFGAVSDVQKALSSAQIPQGTAPTPDVVVFFSGQGSQYAGMAKGLMKASTMFSRTLCEADKFLVEKGFAPFVDSLCTGESLNDEATQCAIFCVDYAICQLLKSFNVQPSALAGHSLGEYCALACSGVLSFEDALYLVASRARLVVQKCTPGAYGMLAVRADVEACHRVIESMQSPCEIACDNGVESVTISGDMSALSRLGTAFQEQNIKTTLLNVNFAFHSQAMDAILGGLQEVASKVTFAAPHTAVYSNVLGRVVAPGEKDVFHADYLVKHARNTVRFRDALVHAQEIRASQASASQKRKGLTPQIAVEAGADAIILPMLRTCDPAFGQILPTLKKRQHDIDGLMSTLAKLWTAQVPVDWRAVYSELFAGARFINSTPTYPFDDTRFYTPFTDRGLIKPDEEVYVTDPSEVTVRRDAVVHSGKNGMQADLTRAGFLQMTSLDRGEKSTVAHFTVVQDEYFVALARNHRVGETALTPGTLTGVVCQQAASLTLAALGLHEEAGELFCRAMHLPGPLPMPEKPDRVISVRCTVIEKPEDARKSHQRASHLVSCALVSEKAKTTAIHNEITLETAPEVETASEFARLEPILLPTLASVQAETDCEVLHRELAYSLFGRCVIYGTPYQAMSTLRMRPDLGVAHVVLGRGRSMPGYTTLPRLPDSLTIDAVGQLPGLMLNLLSSELDDDHVFILDSCGRTAFLPRLKELEEAGGSVLVLGTSRIEPRTEEAKGEVYALADTFTFEETPQGPKLIAVMLGSRYHKMRTRTLLSVLKTVA